ncbi:endonuclease/exonuclease/phosphatase family protein [Deinococcus aerophilus]|uniref:Endonuclease/exonuclease/phosphatase domain-containing protein n=1 Tax=Deinococcus aerophilus TaxID=522488 RepID=A0ABQ2GV74_9DEIO|nr:endonuclease/exonuclease/phosphatase family protein [Deinococcus aerophilus]GGM13190.1 hypothetical protein GCM10010841_22250 [Deinococcus aerophilus]
MLLKAKHRSAVAGLSVALVLIAVGWGWLARQYSETWWWVATIDLMPPQMLMVAFAALAWAAWRERRLLWVLWNVVFAAAFLVLQVGLVVPLGRVAQAEAPPSALTLMTLNTWDAAAQASELAGMARRQGADIIALQEARKKNQDGSAYAASLRAAFPGWTLVRQGELLTLSRLPIVKTSVVALQDSRHLLLVTRIQTDSGPLTVVNVHLPTLALLPRAQLPGDPKTLRERVKWRLGIRQALPRALDSVQADAAGPLVLAGDLNAPAWGELHALLRQRGLQDAFREAGSGFGFTFRAGLGFLRLDYVWGQDVRFIKTRALSDGVTSDHRVLLVRLALPAEPTTARHTRP